MNLAVVDASNPLSIAFSALTNPFCVSCVPIEDFASVEQATAALLALELDALVFPLAATISQTEDDWDEVRQLLMVALDACQALDLPLVHISDHHVFDDHKAAPYYESDPVCPFDHMGSWLASLEELVATKVDRAIVLRTSWLYGPYGDNFVTRLIALAEASETLSFDTDLLGCPTAYDDVVRVVVAMLQQLHTGAQRWGLYHYCSSDITNGYQFAESLLAILSQYDQRLVEASPMLLESDGTAGFSKSGKPIDLMPISPASLACQLIFNTFGIKQRPWRSYLTSTVQTLFAKK
jgi:dTDP-4-dehydrorhamnose reductase